MGLSQKEAAHILGVDPGTLARWERGEREPTGAFLDSVTRFLADDTRQCVRTRRAGKSNS
jgi:transcriptional regulator with XRE-family HTH domain